MTTSEQMIQSISFVIGLADMCIDNQKLEAMMSARDITINIMHTNECYYGDDEICSKLQPSDTANTCSKMYDTEL